MPSPFINATFLNLTPERGLCHDIAYLCRTTIEDHRLHQTITLTHVDADLAYREIRLPHNAPVAFEDVQLLANAADQADARHMRKAAGRKRWPQLAVALIVSLPPDDEATLDEARELIERIVARIIGDRKLVAVVAIHDPRLITPGARNRHCHVLIILREVEQIGFGKKARDVFARARFGSSGRYYVAEGVNWPDLSSEMQQALFSELATDTIVDPPAPIPEKRWPEATIRKDPMRIAKHRRETREKNIEFIYGPADALVEQMLRGRGTMSIEELRRLLARFIDGESARRDRLDEVLADPRIVSLAVHTGEPRPTRLTTRVTYDLMMQATSIVDRAAKKSPRDDASRLSVVSGETAEAVGQALLAQVNVESPLLVGARSDCAALQKQLAPMGPTTVSVAALVHSLDGGARGALPHAGLIVVPCAHSLQDKTLAKIMAAVDAYGGRLLLGYDESADAGIAAHRLAAYAADALAPVTPNRAHWVERQLRSGLVDRAIAALNNRGTLHFAQAGEPAIDSMDFVVCDDVRQIDAINARMSTARAGTDKIGRWIAVTRTDYSARPPMLVEGRLAQVVESSADGQTMRVRLADGSTTEIDRVRYPYVRPALAISIREARQAPSTSQLAIELTQQKSAWAALLVAASRDPDRVTVRVDSAVARDIEGLSRVVRANLPAALPVELTMAIDPETVLAPTLQAAEMEDWIEYLPVLEVPPVPSPPEVRQTSLPSRTSRRSSSLVPASLHPDLRAILARADCEPGLLRLTTALALHNPERQEVADRLLKLCQADSPTRELIGALLRPSGQMQRGDRLAELDLPNALADQAPRAWDPWPLYACSIDLKTMSLRSSHWQSAFDIAAPESEAEMASSPSPFLR